MEENEAPGGGDPNKNMKNKLLLQLLFWPQKNPVSMKLGKLKNLDDSTSWISSRLRK